MYYFDMRMLYILPSFLLFLISVQGQVKIYPTKLEVVSSTTQYNLPLLGNYILKPNQGNRGPIYQNEESGDEILFDGRRFWRSINEDYLVIPAYPKDDGGKD